MDKALADLANSVDALRGEVAAEREARNRQTLWLRGAVALLAVIVVFQGLVYWGNRRADQADERRANEAAMERRQAVCAGFDEFTDQLALVSTRDPAELERIVVEFKRDFFLSERMKPLDCPVPAPLENQ